MEHDCTDEIWIEPSAGRSENAEALAGWTTTGGRTLCPAHAQAPTWLA